MGLAYPSLSAAGSTSFGLTMVQQNQYALYPYFSMMLSYGGRSEITFGGFNRARVLSGSSSYWFNATPDPNGVRTYWQMGLSVPYVGNTRAGGYTTHILDSGTTLIVTSPAQAAEFWAAVPGSAKYDDNFWSFPCASPPDVKFSFSRNTVFKYGVDQDGALWLRPHHQFSATHDKLCSLQPRLPVFGAGPLHRRGYRPGPRNWHVVDPWRRLP